MSAIIGAELMARTVIGLNDPKAVKRFSAFLAVDSAKVSYFKRKFMGYGQMASRPIQMLSQLESDAGEQISYDLSMQLRMKPVEGDNVLENREEPLTFYTDNVYINQARGGVNTGGRMARKRTIHDLRILARKRQSEWWGRVFDELFFIYLTGKMGSGFANTGWIYDNTYTGFASNPLEEADADHILYGGDASSKATLADADVMTVNYIERAATKAETMGGGSEDLVQLQPCKIDGNEHFCIVMHPFSAHNLRTQTGAENWLEIQKASAGAEGRRSNIFHGSLGMHDNVVLHKHKNVPLFNDYGAGNNVNASRALFLGEQAAVCAFGSPGTGLRFDWHEATRDNGNQVVISTASIFGIKKTRFNKKDYGVLALDHASKNPN